MKKYLLSFLILLASTALFGQHPYPAFLLDTTSVWSMEWGWDSQFGSSYHSYSLSGEFYHVIDGKEYLVVRENGQNSFITGTGGGNGPSYVNKNHFVRTDSANRQILFYDQDSAKERILFDFNLALGDTLKPYQLGMGTSRYETYPAPEFGKLRVVAIDSFWVSRQFVYMYYIVQDTFGWDPFYSIIYEGIGHEWGLVNPLANVNALNCFSHNGKAILGSQPCEVLNVGLDEGTDFGDMKVADFPDSWQLQVKVPTQLTFQLRLIDLHGRVLLQKQLQLTGNQLLTEEIPKTNLPSGLYLLQISTPTNQKTWKLWKE